MVEGRGGIRGWFMRTFGAAEVSTSVAKAPSSTPLEKSLVELLKSQLEERMASSRTQDGSGASGGTTIPEITAEPGIPVVTKLAQQKRMPPMDTTKLGPPL